MGDSRCRFHGKDLREGRISAPGQDYLLTTVTVRRALVFSDFALGRCVVRAMRHPAIISRVVSITFVVMPDHVHWLIQLGESEKLSAVMRSFKAGSAKPVNRKRGCPRTSLWQSGYHDHALRSEEDLQQVAR